MRAARSGPATGAGARPAVALVPWGLLLEDFLEPSGLTLEEFCGDFTGSWMFGFADALRQAGVDTVIVSVSSKVEVITRLSHAATGTAISLLPAPRAYRSLRERMRDPYGRTASEVFGATGASRFARPGLFAVKELAPYLATPVRSLLRELRFHSCGAVLCQEYEFPRFDLCVATQRLHGLPVFGVFQGGDYQRWRIERLIRPRTVAAAAGLIVSSAAERERVSTAYRPARVAPIPNPVDLSVWRPRDRAQARAALGIRDEALVVGWHGRIQIGKKGLDILVDAWAVLTADRELDVQLLLVGGGGDTAELSSLLHSRGFTNVTWIDRYVHRQEEIAELLAAADVYVFPSRHEGFPVAPLEAMACGLPVVASDVSGIRDVMQGSAGSVGALVPVGDAQALAAALRELLTDPDGCRRKGLAARASAESYGLEAVGLALRSLTVGSRDVPGGQ